MSTSVIPIPTDEKAFERQCRVLFAELLGDPHIKLVGTKGKNQGGLDLMGTRQRDPHQPVGVQCKLITKAGGKLDLVGVRSDITRALALSPPLTEIYVVTTASDDLTYDTLAMTMRQEQAALGRTVEIQIWGWDNLQEHIREHVAALKAFDPYYSVTTELLIDLGQENVKIARQSSSRLEKMDAKLTALSIQISHPADSASTATIDIVFNAQLDSIRDLLNTGRPRSALGLLEALESSPPAALSDPIQSRILANKGWAYLRLGDHIRGGNLLIEAHKLNPDDPKSRANRVFGLLLLEDVDGALAEGRAILIADPMNAAAASFVYQAAASAPIDVDPEGFVPVNLRSDENVAITRIVYLRKHRLDGSWQDAAREAVKSFPESRIMKRFDAEAQLDVLYERRSFSAAAVDHEDRYKLELATQTLQQLWDEDRRGEVAEDPIAAGLAANLIIAYRALRNLESAALVAAQALERAPNFDDLLVAAAHVDVLAGHSAAAIEKLNRAEPSPTRSLALVMALADLDQWDRLIEETNTIDVTDMPDFDRQAIDSMRVQALIVTGQTADAALELDKLLAARPGNLPMAVTVADLAGQYVASRFDEYLEVARKLLAQDTPLGERLMLAELAIRKHQFTLVIEALDGHLATDTLTDPLVWLAVGFANAPVTKRTRKFFEGLDSEVVGHRRLARIAGFSAYNRGDLVTARQNFECAIAVNPTDVRAHMLLHGCLQRDARWDEADQLIIAIDENSVVGDAIDRMRLAGALRRAGQVDRAFSLAFDIASQHREKSGVVGAYPMLFFMSETVPTVLSDQSNLEVGFWFQLKGIGTSDIDALITDSKIDGVLCVDPDQPLAQAVLGKNIGDEIALPTSLGIEQRYRLAEIKHRYIWLLHDIMNSQKARFPESEAFVQMTMEKGDVTPVLDIIRKQEEHSKFLRETYEAGGLPLSALAELTGSDLIGLGDRIVQAGGKLRTCVGTHEERVKAQLAVRQARTRGAFLDTGALIDGWSMDLLEPMINYFGSLTIARETLDDLVNLREKQCWDANRESMTMGFDGEQAYRVMHSPEEKTRNLANLERLILFARDRLTIISDDGAEISMTAPLAASGIGEFLRPVALALEHQLLLISDDLHLRQIADAESWERHCWLQALALEFRDQDLLDAQTYARVAAQCASCGKHFVTVDSQSLLTLLGLDENDSAFAILAQQIGGPSADMPSHTGVVVDIAVQVWTIGLAHWKKGRALGRLLTALISGFENPAEPFLVALENYFRRRPVGLGQRPDLAAEYIADWRRGHFLSTVAKPANIPKLETKQKRNSRRRV
jgi:cellulose synthase operon protein C